MQYCTLPAMNSRWKKTLKGCQTFLTDVALEKNALPHRTNENKTIINKHMKLFELMLHSYLP